MKRLLCLCLLLAGGCGRQPARPAAEKPVIFAGIPPIAGLAERIAGEDAQVRTLLPPGRSPHDYAPTPRQAAELADAAAFLSVGLPFEQRLEKKLAGACPDLKIFHLGDHIARRRGEKKGTPDPHVWLSPENARKLAAEIRRALSEIDPAHADDYRKRFEALDAELQETDAYIRKLLAPYRGRAFYVFHPSFGYFADAYGLRQKAVEFQGKEPSARRLAAWVEQARRDRIRTLFIQRGFPDKTVKVMAAALRARVETLDPLARDLPRNFREIAEKLAASFRESAAAGTER